MSRRYVSEYVTKQLCNVAVLESLTETGSAATAVIGTHNGTFHCDEALACGMLRCTSQFAAANILRTRDASKLEKCHVVVDVGGVYEPEKMRFDHHQPSFQGTMTTPKATYHTRLSSAGLVYKHFGREIIQSYVESALASPYREQLLTSGDWGSSKKNMTEEELDLLFDVVYRNFVEHVDGIDNGINAYGPAEDVEATENSDSTANINNDNNTNNKVKSSCVQKYRVTTTLSDRVGDLLPWWNEENHDDDAAINAGFLQAVSLAASEFFHCVHFHTFAWLPARRRVAAAFHDSYRIHPSGRIVVLPGPAGCPWKEHLRDLEKEEAALVTAAGNNNAKKNEKEGEEEKVKGEGRVLYVLFPDGRGGWRVQAVGVDAAGFALRRPLPWRGLRGAELQEASGVPGGVFVHASGFIGGNETYEGALQMAIKALTTV
ncbi:metal binding protein [Trypanosoma theileri]|uniref:Metal binding protein n=1 Tax=Trypanosoma theileri TaxID=67003 RepID=A0A1X0NMG9_9TRYP|nr:metal binding protein [Trypanosoma theileri]ORC85934.1 metal binding protein [Trypanosoma theileri]